MTYALFLGCIAPVRAPSYEHSLRRVMKNLDVSLVDLKDAACCAPIPIESVDLKTGLALAAYNLCLSEEADLDLMTVCNGCFQTLSRANTLLNKDEKIRAEVNSILAASGKEYKGTHKVRHYIQVLSNDVGLDRVKESVSRPLTGLKAAAFHGCHLLMPSAVLKVDDPEDPTILNELIRRTGAESPPYAHSTRCCGGLLRGVDDDIASKMTREKLFNISQISADCVVTICPFCFLQLDIGQIEVNRRFKDSYAIPVLHYPELLGLAMGMKPDELGLNTHKIRTDSLQKRIGL